MSGTTVTVTVSSDADIVPSPPMPDARYAEWVEAFRVRFSNTMRAQGHLYGLCGTAAHEMAEAFPELRVVRGYVGRYEPTWDDGEPHYASGDGHWWCVRISDGAIVDPTACQFFACLGGRFPRPAEYEEHDDAKHGKLPTGKCPECGLLIYDGAYVHDECEAAFRRSLG